MFLYHRILFHRCERRRRRHRAGERDAQVFFFCAGGASFGRLFLVSTTLCACALVPTFLFKTSEIHSLYLFLRARGGACTSSLSLSLCLSLDSSRRTRAALNMYVYMYSCSEEGGRVLYCEGGVFCSFFGPEERDIFDIFFLNSRNVARRPPRLSTLRLFFVLCTFLLQRVDAHRSVK